MPQVKIKQGSKSAVNNNAGVLNAGTLAITTDTNELFVTHNDGTVHQLCNPVIGGRNLVLNSGFTSTDGWRSITGSILGVDNGELSFSAGSGFGWRALMSSSTNLISLKAGSFYTVSYELMLTDSTISTDFFLGFSRYELYNPDMDEAWIMLNVRNQIDPDVVNEWQTIKATVQATHDVDNSALIRFGISDSVIVKVRRVKIEKGNIATDWTPAPEDKADDSQSINYDLSAEPAETGTKNKTANTLWQNLFNHTNFLWAKVKDLFTAIPLSVNDGYIPKIDDVNKKLIKSNINDNGSRIDLGKPLRVNSNTFYNVAQKINNAGNETGTIYIEMPFGGTDNMGTFEIDIYNYNQDTKAKIIVSGYNYNGGGGGGYWINTSLQILGSLPSNVVRLGYNSVTQKCCILIGNTNSVWSYPQIYVSKVTQGFYNTADWSTGWSISLITSETDITVSSTPTANVGMMLDGIDSAGFQKIKTAYLYKTLIAPTSNDFWVRIGSITSFSAYSVTNLVIQSMNGNDAPRVLDINIVLNYWANSVRLIQNIATSYRGDQSTWGQTELIITEDQKVWLRFVGSTQNFVHKMIVKSTDDTFQFSTEFTEVLYSAPTNILRTLTFMEGALNTSDLDIKVKRVIKAGSDDSYMLLGGGGEKLISDFATSTHNHEGVYSTTDTKNTAGATDTSSKIYLVGSTAQSANPQTYTHDTAYVDVDGNLYSGNSKTITNSDLLTNQIVTPTLNPTWTVRNYAGTVVSSPTNPSGEAITGTNIVLEYGFKPSMIVKGKWVTQAGYDNPTSCSGLCGTSLPASNVETAATSSIDLYNSTTYSSTTFPITTSDYWTISTPKKGITVSGSSLVLPIGNISASARTQVTYQLPVYYGNITTLTITEANVELLTTKTWKNYQANSKSVSPIINSTDSEYWIYAYPAAWGNLNTISNNDGDWMAAFTSSTVSITGAPGLAILYNYYITVNKGAFKSKTINFS